MLTLCGIFISESFAVSAGTSLVIKGNYGLKLDCSVNQRSVIPYDRCCY